MHSIFYLTHRDSGRRLRYYKSLAGARIAQRARNSRLGFLDRIERVWMDRWEIERCRVGDRVMDATWVIEEDTSESADLLVES
jgi:hypothetical protein